MEDDDFFDEDMEFERMREDAHFAVDDDAKELVEILYSKLIIGILKIQQAHQNNAYWRGRKEKLIDVATTQVLKHFKEGTAIKDGLRKIKALEKEFKGLNDDKI